VKILAVQNIECETLGSLEEMLRSDRHEIELVQAPIDHVPQACNDYGWVVILGGPMAAYDNLSYLHKEQNLIRSAIKSDVPVLGICLGSQLIAHAAGGHVFKGGKKEIGWYDVMLTRAGHSDVFRGIDKRARVFQWHGDTYDLPVSARLLAKNDLYPQAFRIGSAVGIQFHLEVDLQMIKRWSQEYEKEMTAEGLALDDLIPKENEQTELESMCHAVYKNFAMTLRTAA
jgi:GMP synthase (glutamine-hydrolysing)